MEKFLKIIKINILSLIALPFLLLSTVCKLISKGLEKIVIILGLIFSTVTLMIVLQMFRSIETTMIVFLIIAIITALLLIGAIFTFIAYVMFQFAYTFVVLLYCVLLSFFEQAYIIFYSIYALLHQHCQEEYEYINFNEHRLQNGCFCFCYSLLRGLNWLITAVFSVILPISLIASIGWIIWSIWSINHKLYQTFGMGLFEIMCHFNKYDLICDIATCFVLAFFVISILFTLGSEWDEYGKELKMRSGQYNEKLYSFTDKELHMDDEQLEEMGSNKVYMEKLQKHINDFDIISDEVEQLLNQKDNDLLKSHFVTYFSNLSQLAEICTSYGAKIPLDKFKTMIPQIQQLDKQLAELNKLASKLKEEYKNPFQTAVFFNGCNSLEKLEKRYKSLCKAYHPDVSGGDEETFKKMQAEYESLKSSFA